MIGHNIQREPTLRFQILSSQFRGSPQPPLPRRDERITQMSDYSNIQAIRGHCLLFFKNLVEFSEEWDTFFLKLLCINLSTKLALVFEPSSSRLVSNACWEHHMQDLDLTHGWQKQQNSLCTMPRLPRYGVERRNVFSCLAARLRESPQTGNI